MSNTSPTLLKVRIHIQQLSLIYLVKERPVVKTRCKKNRVTADSLASDLVLLQKPPKEYGGAMRDRTADLFRAREALSQLSYSPI